MPTNDLQPDDHVSYPRRNLIHYYTDNSQKYKDTKTDKEPMPVEIKERRFLVRCVICLSVLGVIAFLVTGQVAVVIAMNAPLLAIVGKDYFLR